MTTWADVAKDAIDAAKIILPILITAVLGGGKIAYEHLSKRFTERRERRFKAIEDAEEASQKFFDTWVSVLAPIQAFHRTPPESQPGLRSLIDRNFTALSESTISETLMKARRRLLAVSLFELEQAFTPLISWEHAIAYLKIISPSDNDGFILTEQQANDFTSLLSTTMRELEPKIIKAYHQLDDTVVSNLISGVTQGLRQ